MGVLADKSHYKERKPQKNIEKGFRNILVSNKLINANSQKEQTRYVTYQIVLHIEDNIV